MSALTIKTAEVFEPLLHPARDKAAYGGRGSGKSNVFADMLIEDSLAEPGESGEGLRSVCIREIQKDLAQSSKALLESKLRSLGLGEPDGFKVFRDVIETPQDGIIIFKGMNDYTADSIKSLEGFKRGWWEEAQGATQNSINLYRPTMRASGSQMWWSWNPRRKTDPVDIMFRGEEKPTGATVVHANWRDNPWFTAELEQERQDCLRIQPDQYDHIWEGGYISIIAGAYYAKSLAVAKGEGRIGRVAADPLMTLRAFVDIGGTGARADAFSMWIGQFVGREIRVLDYYEAIGQPLSAHLNWMRDKGYTSDRCQFWLPHDGASNDKVYDVSYESALMAAGYKVTVVKNQGKGAAKARIEAGRRLFPQMWFDNKTQPGLDALGWYHEKKDEVRGIGLGPEHDWACLVGSTKVLTRYGIHQIMELPITGEVMTPCGWKRYINPRITRRNARLVEVQFTDGHTVKCTADHLFLTASGWKFAGSLRKGSLTRSTLTQQHSILTAVYIACGLVTGISVGAVGSCIEMFGLERSGLFRKAATYITKTATQLTTHWKTLSAWMQASIFGIHGQLALSQNTRQGSISAIQQGLRQQSGTHLRPEGYGIAGTQNEASHGQNGSGNQSHALSAEKRSMLLLERAGTRRFIAANPAKWLRIEGVKRTNEQQDVWCLTVPDVHCFSLANGAVVHNSHGADSFGLLCVAYELPDKSKEKPIQYPKNSGIV